jgi:hypothetical protein
MAEAACDMCGRTIGRIEPHYLATIDIRPTSGLTETDEEAGDRDHLLELHEMLERLDEDALAEPDEEPLQTEFLLCDECCRRFREDPLPREFAVPLDFSAN